MTATTAQCWCGVRIVHVSGPSWRHVGRQNGDPHPATPSEQAKTEVRR